MEYNYHTHTVRCNHATGEAEEYVIRAIENGVKFMGFSDHVPLKFADGNESGYRIPDGQGKAYCDEIKTLAKKYKDKIEIKVGFEMEYYPKHFEKTLKEVKESGGEYLILGQHFSAPENTGVPCVTAKTDSAEELKKYVDVVISAMKTGVFTYVAHPDIINFVGDVDIYKTEMRRLCTFSRELNVPLEINFLGIRTGRSYPAETFWQVAGEEKSPVVFGFDAHDVESAYDSESLVKAEELVRKFNLNYIGKPNLVIL